LETATVSVMTAQLSVVTELDHQVPGVAVSEEGPVFVNFPPWTEDSPGGVKSAAQRDAEALQVEVDAEVEAALTANANRCGQRWLDALPLFLQPETWAHHIDDSAPHSSAAFHRTNYRTEQSFFEGPPHQDGRLMS
jgi:hypothetical protein